MKQENSRRTENGAPTNQNQSLAQYLKANKNGITSAEAFTLFGITRLSARIYELRDSGMNIVTISETSKNRYGNPTTYARYRLVG